MTPIKAKAIDAIRNTGLDCASWSSETLAEIVDAVIEGIYNPSEEMKLNATTAYEGDLIGIYQLMLDRI